MSIKYPDYIAPERIPVDTPEALVDENGKCHFGTFKDTFKKLNLIDCKKPCGPNMPDFMKASRITEWEAFEIHMKEGALVSAVYKTASMGFSIFVWFDKRTNKCLSWWNPTIPASKAKVATQLVDDYCYHKTGKSEYEICNDLLNGKAHAKGYSKGKCGTFEIDMSVTRISNPCIVSIPFGENKPLYSQKEFLKAEGTITVNGETFVTDENSLGIIDDHKGYYPFKAHYDWLTTMGQIEIDGEMKNFAFNLTRNQSIDQDKYNENLIWLDGVSYPLPPVTFSKEGRYAKTWYIKDEHGCVDLRFEIDDVFYIIMHLLVIDSYYALPFGRIYGTVKDTNGKVYTLDGALGIAEDKTTRM